MQEFIASLCVNQGLVTDFTKAVAVYPGFIIESARADVPSGWLECDGSAVSRTTYADLFAAIGTTFGAGNGTTTFNLPDLRGRVAVGVGQGSGLTNRTLGSTFGAESRTLAIDDLPDHYHTITIGSHTHSFTASHSHTITDSGHTHGITDPMHGHTYTGVNAVGNYASTAANAGPAYQTNATSQSATGITINSATTGISINSSNVSGTTASGGSYSGATGGITIGTLNQAVSLMQPSIALKKLIKT